MSGFVKHEFEAIAAFEHSNTPEAKAVLIVEPQYSHAALCLFNSKGCAEAHTVWSDCTSDIASDFKLDIKGSGAQIKNAIKYYYMTNKAMDSNATPDTKASEYMEYYSSVGGSILQKAVSEAATIMRTSEIPTSDICFLFVGNAADFFPAEAIVRLEFSPAMPMITDKRFKTLNNTVQAVTEGTQLLKSFTSKLTDGKAEWSVISADGSISTVLLVASNTSTDNLSTPVYTKPVLAFPEDILELKVCDKPLTVKTPDGLLSDSGGMLQLAIVYTNDEFRLMFKCENKESSIPIEINVKGA